MWDEIRATHPHAKLEISIIAAAIEQAYKEGVEAMRDEASSQCIFMGKDKVSAISRYELYSIAARLLSAKGEVR